MSDTVPASRLVPPGPQGRGLLGCMTEYRDDPLRFMRRVHQEYGEIVRYRIGPIHVVQVNHPEYARHILVDQAQKYQKARNLEQLLPLMGRGLFLSEGESWLEKRRTMQPAFDKHRLPVILAELVQVVSQRLATWELIAEDDDLELTAEFMELSLSFAGRSLFAIDLGGVPGIAKLLDALLKESFRRVSSMNPFISLAPNASNRAFKSNLQKLNEIVSTLIDQRRKAPRDGDLFSSLDHFHTGDRHSAADQRLRDELVTFCLAGRGPTGLALAWMFYLLARHPDVWKRVRNEVNGVLSKCQPTETDLPKLSYSTMVFEETMRLYPPVWVITRQAIMPDEVGGYAIKKGTILIISPYVIHHHPAFWTYPERFDPERFSADRVGGSRRAYLPFGAGPRMCIGARLALMEAQVVLAMVARRFQLCLTSEQRIDPEPMITLRPKGGIRVRLRRYGPSD